MQKYNLQDWQEPYGKLKTQLVDYDTWIKANVLPKARTDFRLPPEEYDLALEELRHRYSQGKTGRDGARCLHRIPG